uniref:Uncharacterized protein n=1 Tax=Alexandrium catenella TaxID=2925 RepID=A0A7S1S496_ALECA
MTHRPDEKTGKSMYAVHYPWHDVEPTRAAKPSPGVPLNDAPFEARTSYMTDYIKHPVRPRSATTSARPRGEPLPFEATTTYNNDYQNIPTARNPPAKPLRATLAPDGSPFVGSSEYKREYTELKMEHRPMVHLEPEIRREPRRPQSRSGSTPVHGRKFG